MMTIFSCIPVSTVCPSESLEDYTFEDEALVAGSKDDEKKLIGPRLVFDLVEFPMHWPGENCTCQTSRNLKDTS